MTTEHKPLNFPSLFSVNEFAGILGSVLEMSLHY
jgi:hypothetical protein